MQINKKKQVLIYIFLLAKSIVFSQSTDNDKLMLKEFFGSKKYRSSSIYLGLDYGTFRDSTVFSDKSGADDLAEVNAPVMDAQLVLYETTKDKGYLINFINDAIQMVSMRADYMQNRLGIHKYKTI